MVNVCAGIARVPGSVQTNHQAAFEVVLGFRIWAEGSFGGSVYLSGGAVHGSTVFKSPKRWQALLTDFFADLACQENLPLSHKLSPAANRSQRRSELLCTNWMASRNGNGAAMVANDSEEPPVPRISTVP